MKAESAEGRDEIGERRKLKIELEGAGAKGRGHRSGCFKQ